ncbi:uncharacterized protein PGTG_05293 [Puccinia graminis f. sp. tritici CRL 75-36-700-3]|uniref:Uncharacterized protein n=1 Tax=Puccinia graminis f. sp. tritici (strain CRL 75-36-700-3 / race SCCL) TaxID=418459 RepID=E3K6W9_PUCGT|nr:uncharacterized protein PGTG_05293 [Puccinia graminis f. sp. tritici CRL 75-36-700-3]EFP80068.2 hypothetical protein PGTG_05293 [Puccinia graminis f. sp. tritici CRL 75-36-700-3]
MRHRKAPERYGNWAKSSTVPLDDIDTPKTWHQLQKSPHKAKWLQAADEEFSSLLGMDTWKLVPRRAGPGASGYPFGFRYPLTFSAKSDIRIHWRVSADIRPLNDP